jgi:hypothetical protein
MGQFDRPDRTADDAATVSLGPLDAQWALSAAVGVAVALPALLLPWATDPVANQYGVFREGVSAWAFHGEVFALAVLGGALALVGFARRGEYRRAALASAALGVVALVALLLTSLDVQATGGTSTASTARDGASGGVAAMATAPEAPDGLRLASGFYTALAGAAVSTVAALAALVTDPTPADG